MARANRHHLPGYVWHITHRCHKREFLLKFDKDKKRWVNWLFESKKRFGLEILNYTVTSNHIHLLVFDNKENVIPKSIQLIAGRTAREYNLRKKRKGAFWEDRYHATAIETGKHLVRCLLYIDLNMVRAGVIQHPSEWKYGGYNEIQNPKLRYSLINRQRLTDLLEIQDYDQLSIHHRKWIGKSLNSGLNVREKKWTEGIAVGDRDFVLKTQVDLGAKTIGRRVIKENGAYELREIQTPYNSVFDHEKRVLSQNNRCFWDVFPDNTI